MAVVVRLLQIGDLPHRRHPDGQLRLCPIGQVALLRQCPVAVPLERLYLLR